MARKIIILEQIGMPSDLNYRVAFWLGVPAARQAFLANPAAVSVVVGATVEELEAIRSGAVREVVEVVPAVAGTPFNGVRQAARNRLTDLQRDFNRDNTWNRYGTSWDGAAWTDVTVA